MKDSLLFPLKLALVYGGSPVQPSQRGSTPAGLGGARLRAGGVPGRSPVTKQFRLLWNLRCFQVQERRVKPFSIAAVLLTSRTRRDGFVRSPLLGVRPPRRGAGLRPLPRLQLRELARLLDALDGFVRY